MFLFLILCISMFFNIIESYRTFRSTHPSASKRSIAFRGCKLYSSTELTPEDPEAEISSREIERLKKKIDETSKAIEEVRQSTNTEKEELTKLEAEFGEEVLIFTKQFYNLICINL